MIINGLLALLFAKELTVLWNMRQSAIAALNSNILASDKEAFLEKIRQMNPSWWMWTIGIVSLLITIALLVGWWLPKFHHLRPVMARLSLIWTLAWLTYLVIIVVNTALALSQVLS
jgi:hypothetical protein